MLYTIKTAVFICLQYTLWPLDATKSYTLDFKNFRELSPHCSCVFSPQALKAAYVAFTIPLAPRLLSNQMPPFAFSTSQTTSPGTARTASCPSGCRTPSSLWWVLGLELSFASKHSPRSWAVSAIFILWLWFGSRLCEVSHYLDLFCYAVITHLLLLGLRVYTVSMIFTVPSVCFCFWQVALFYFIFIPRPRIACRLVCRPPTV